MDFVCGGLRGVYNAVMKKGLFIKIIICLVVTFSAPVVSSFVMEPGGSDWYANLNKPFFNPPGWVFGPVWTVLYILMAVSAGLVWQKGLAERKVRAAMGLYLAQLILNAIWTPLFFGLEMPLPAFIDIVLLWAAIVFTILAFLRVSKIAGVLMVPYLVWTTFAAVLNFSLWYLNR